MEKESNTELPLVQVRQLSKTYQEGDRVRTVLNGVTFSIQEGELVVLLGRSGSGKSTLLNLISGIDLPSDGDVLFGETNLTRLSEQERTLFRREHIGFVFQSFNLIPTLTVAENILLPLELTGRMRPDEQERALSFLDHVDLRDRADSFPDRLSGGEQQRVAIARALAHEPLLILADEPTGNLDYQTGRHVMDLLNQLIHQVGRTMLIASHDRDILELADRVLTLREGSLDEHTEMLVSGSGDRFR